MAKKSKSTFNESFTQGVGGEMGKRTGTIIVVGIIFIALTIAGYNGCNSTTTENPGKTPGIHSNTE